MRKLAARSSSTKVLASVVLVAGAASVAGLGTFGAFTSTTSASEVVSTETVELGKADHATLGTDVVIPKLVPGDSVQRALTLTRAGDTTSFGSVKLTTTGIADNLLTSDISDGLQLAVEQCSVPWTADVAAKTLTCTGGTTASIITDRAVLGANLDLGAATTALNTEAAASHLKLTLSLPDSADNDFKNLSDTITFTFTATQRDATNR